MAMPTHACINGIESDNPSWWEHDYRGIPLARVCDDCRKTKLARYRPEILTGYDEGDVDEAIVTISLRAVRCASEQAR